MKTSLHLREAIKEESKPSESTGDEESCVEEIFLQVGAGKKVEDNDRMKQPSPNQNNLNCSKQGVSTTNVERSSPESDQSRSSSSAKRQQVDDEFGSTKAEMDEVMEENQRLKKYLDRILKDYRTLQMQYRDVIEHDQKSPHEEEHDQSIDLNLGMSSTKTILKRKSPTNDNIINNVQGGDHKQDLALALDYSRSFDLPNKSPPAPSSPEYSVEETKEETWPPKTTIKNNGEAQDEAQQNPAKRARVSVRVRCDTPTMNDGCQWRKYGQKIAKGNPCPRAYYRCTVAPSCPVRKQVQRCAEDISILITTYEGTHSHPLPISATAMASTTSAAASMLLSGSSTSGTNPGSSSATTGTLNGLNFYLSDTSRPKPFYLPNSSISSSPSCPTITLDLTSSSSNLTRPGSFPTRYSTTNLNFSSLESNPPPISWNNGMLSYGPSQPLIKTTNSLTFGSHTSSSSSPYETLYQSYLQKTSSNPSQHSLLPSDTLAAATKAITSDPSFQSALAAALSSIINGAPNSAAPSNHNAAEKSSNSFPILSSFPSSSSSNAIKCAPAFINGSSSSTSSQPAAGFMRLSPQFPFSNPKSKSTSPSDNRDHKT